MPTQSSTSGCKNYKGRSKEAPKQPKGSSGVKGKTRLKVRSERDPSVDPFFNEMQQIVAKGFCPNMEVDNPDERPTLPFNTLITTRTNKYVVIKKLGAGGFGDVYEVQRERDNGMLAMKTEYDVEDDMLQRLKVG
ncbi:hypothetical protein GCK32_013818 [Trichostrongylus colubriformis]|uniref:Protein kinase domain-containing protein n=1 Tax=Trichostrongylus colubriformis TaxID=6319 RepID=A0AAN8FDY9_TRICO